MKEPPTPLEVEWYLNTNPAVHGLKPQLDYPLHTIGYRDRCTVFSKKAEVVDWWVDTVLGPTGTEYGWMFPEHKGIYQSTVRYFTPYEDPPDYLLDDLENFLEKEFGSLLKACRTLTPWEIIANWQAAAGPLADGFCRELQTYYNMYPLHFAEFWDRAHLEDWPIYWKSTGKVEFLPMEKILAGIPRTFIFPDGPARIAGLRVTQDFNKKMLRLYEATSSAVGMSLYNGGWHRLGNLFQFMTWFGQCDASKWDGRYGPKLHKVVRNFRKKCHWHYEPRLDYIYDNLEHPLVFLPSGELVELDHGQPSGQWSTTPDNTLIHAAMMWLVGKAVCRSLDIEPTMVNILGGFLWKVYGDDLLFACSDQFAPHLEKMMRWIYSQFQFIVKPGAFSFGRELEGVEFLGGRFAVCEETGQWCYSPKPEKLLESAVRSDEAYDEGLQHDRCLSFFLIGFHTPERERLRTLYYCAHRRAILAGKTVPDVFSDLEIERFTHGLEGSDRLASFAEGHEPLKELIDVPWTSHN